MLLRWKHAKGRAGSRSFRDRGRLGASPDAGGVRSRRHSGSGVAEHNFLSLFITKGERISELRVHERTDRSRRVVNDTFHSLDVLR